MGSPHDARLGPGEPPDALALYNARDLKRNRWIAHLANSASLVGTAYTLLAARSSVTWTGAENDGKIALLVLGVPFLILQVLVLSPLTIFSGGVIRWHRPKRGANWFYVLAGLLPAITLTAVVFGMMDRRPGP